MNDQPTLTWRNFPGIVSKGHYAGLDGIDMWECPFDKGTPQHAAWMRGYAEGNATRRRETAGVQSNNTPYRKPVA